MDLRRFSFEIVGYFVRLTCDLILLDATSELSGSVLIGSLIFLLI